MSAAVSLNGCHNSLQALSSSVALPAKMNYIGTELPDPWWLATALSEQYCEGQTLQALCEHDNVDIKLESIVRPDE